MVDRRRKPGSPKGQPKPSKRQLDRDFPKRFAAAFALRPGLTVPQLAAKVGCTRAVLHKYLNGKSKTIEALLLFAIADELGVSAAWLLKNQGQMARAESLSPDENRALNTFGQLNGELRDLWIAQGEELRRRQPSLVATSADPFRVHPPARKQPALTGDRKK